MKLSIIIPVYCVEDTLDRCITSVLHQNISDFEVILVDDGSPDNCPKMCDDWANKENHIKVIHKVNGGLSDARNTGINASQGEYITFVDSDDYLEENTYASLIHFLEEHKDIEILEYPIYIFYGSPKQHLLDFPLEAIYTDMEEYWYDGCAYEHSYACNKIYRRELFNNVRYPVGVLFEDVHTLPQLLKNTQVVATVNHGLYYYTSNPSGITSTADGNALRMLLAPHVEILSNNNLHNYYIDAYYLHVLNIQMDVFESTGDKPILPYRRIRVKDFYGIKKLKAIANNSLGMNTLCKLNKTIHKIWKNH